MLYGKTYQTVTIWTAFLVTGMKNFHTEPPYGDKCHRMKAWYEEFIPVTIWKFHTKMVTDMNIIHMVTYHMVTYSYWYENKYFFRWWHVQTVTSIILMGEWYFFQMVTSSYGDNLKFSDHLPVTVWNLYVELTNDNEFHTNADLNIFSEHEFQTSAAF